MAAQTPNRPAPRLLRLPAVASELDCSLDTVDRLIRSGKLPVIRMPSGRRRIAREDLDSVIEDWKAASR